MRKLAAMAAVWGGLAVCGLFPVAATAQVGKVFPSERKVVKDEKTGVDLVVLTDGKSSDAKIYQTHAQWTADNQWIVFRTGGRSEGSQAYAVNEKNGTIVQLTQGPGLLSNTLNLCRKSMKMYFIRAVPAEGVPTTQPTDRPVIHQMVESDIGSILSDALAGTPKPAATSERVVGALPYGQRESGGFGLDVDEGVAYIGVNGGDAGKYLPPGTPVYVKEPTMRYGTGPGGIRAMDLKTGKISVVIDTPFNMGHVQTNPWVAGEIIYCHETGGDAPQRAWAVSADGSNNRPLFKENANHWVTHETVVTKDEVMLNVLGFQDRLRTQQTGIAVVNLRTGAHEFLGEVDNEPTGNVYEGPGGFWHCNGSPDGKWAVGDTFAGNLHLIDRATKKITLLTVGHFMKPDHLHPTFSPDSTRILVQSGKWTEGQRLQLVVVPVPGAAEK